jgi:hypothetical protein
MHFIARFRMQPFRGEELPLSDHMPEDIPFFKEELGGGHAEEGHGFAAANGTKMQMRALLFAGQHGAVDSAKAVVNLFRGDNIGQRALRAHERDGLKLNRWVVVIGCDNLVTHAGQRLVNARAAMRRMEEEQVCDGDMLRQQFVEGGDDDLWLAAKGGQEVMGASG